MKHYMPWSIKYRPRCIDDLIVSEIDKRTLRSYANDLSKLPPCLLLYGVPGTGKTTVSMMLSEMFREQKIGQIVEIYGSINNTIDYVRSVILPTCSVKGRKLIRIEEFDRFTKDSQMAMRNIIGEDKYYQTSFVLTCNEIWRVHQAIRSRSVEIFFDVPERKQCLARLKVILKSENVSYDVATIDTQLEKLVTFHYPRIRDMINSLEVLSASGTFTFDLSKLLDADDTHKALYMLDRLMFTGSIDMRQIIKISSNVRLQNFYDTVHDKYLELNHIQVSLYALEKQQKLSFVISPALDFIDFFKQCSSYFEVNRKAIRPPS